MHRLLVLLNCSLCLFSIWNVCAEIVLGRIVTLPCWQISQLQAGSFLFHLLYLTCHECAVHDAAWQLCGAISGVTTGALS